ncbi:hypothetical protein KBB08_00470 [Candidatus Gracilibacteria bacterium]|nr:hypothetical protein [Candidatus Gracilibacteria bacterium]
MNFSVVGALLLQILLALAVPALIVAFLPKLVATDSRLSGPLRSRSAASLFWGMILLLALLMPTYSFRVPLDWAATITAVLALLLFVQIFLTQASHRLQACLLVGITTMWAVLVTQTLNLPLILYRLDTYATWHGVLLAVVMSLFALVFHIGKANSVQSTNVFESEHREKAKLSWTEQLMMPRVQYVFASWFQFMLMAGFFSAPWLWGKTDNVWLVGGIFLLKILVFVFALRLERISYRVPRWLFALVMVLAVVSVLVVMVLTVYSL